MIASIGEMTAALAPERRWQIEDTAAKLIIEEWPQS